MPSHSCRAPSCFLRSSRALPNARRLRRKFLHKSIQMFSGALKDSLPVKTPFREWSVLQSLRFSVFAAHTLHT